MTESSSGQRGGDSGGWSIGDLDVVHKPVEAGDPLAMWTKLGLACLFLAVATPLVGLGGLWASALLGQLAGAGLEASHAQLPAVSMTADLDLRWVYLVALAVMGLRAGVSRLPRPTWRVAGLGPWRWWLLLGGGLWLATGASLVFERGVLDIADGVHIVVLGSTWLWSTATAMWLIASIGRAGVVLLAVASQRSRIVGGSVSVVGIASMVIATPVLANPEVIDVDDIYRDAPVLAAVRDDLSEAKSSLGISSSGGGTVQALLPASRESVADDRYTTNECMEKLVEPENDGPSRLTKVIRKLRGGHRNAGIDLEDIVYWKMIDVCVDEPRRNGKDLFGLLLTACRNGLTDEYRHRAVVAKWEPVLAAGHDAQCLIDAIDGLEESLEDQPRRLATAAKALQALAPDKRQLLDDHYRRQLSFAEMARSRGKSAGSVAKATNRTVHDLRKWLARHCD